jgi:hypothetical protein
MAANNQRTITLKPFCTDNAAGWFAHMESRFRAKGVMDEWDRFDHTVPALSKEIVQLCFHAVAHPDDEPYSVLKQHTHTKYQRIERLLAVGPLGSRRPSQLLAEMMELCPDDEEASCFFMFFLQRLPAWLRIQLEGDNQDDIWRLAMKADRLFALHGHKHSGAVAVVESQEDEDEAAKVNAIQGGRQRGNGMHGGQQGHGGQGGQGSQSGSQQQGAGGKALTPSEATAAAGICWNYWRFAENASHCKGLAVSPCGWQIN